MPRPYNIPCHLPPEGFFQNRERGQRVAFGGREAGKEIVEEVRFLFMRQLVFQRGIVEQRAQRAATEPTV